MALLVSPFIPGLGPLMIGDKRRARIFFITDIVWLLLFFPPFRLPAYYVGVLFLLFSGLTLAIVACWQTSTSRSESYPASSNWLTVLLLFPLCFVVMCLWWGIALRAGGFRIFKIPSTSMEPAIQQGDQLISDMRAYYTVAPARGDVVVFHSPMDPRAILMKRLIAKGGDTIRSVNGQIFLNDKPLSESYVQHSGDAPDELMNFGPISVPPHKLFVMGDNRDLSLDSRSENFGLVDESAVMGKPLYIFAAGHDRTGKALH